ncbi:MAG: porin family protein [Ferruginibacter sp.]
MKKFLTVLMILGFTGSVFAQKTYIQAGINLANITKTNDGGTEDNNVLTSFNVGLMHRFGLSPIVDLEAGLLFTGKGSKAETFFGSNDYYVKTKFNPFYLEVPLNVLVKVPIGLGTKLFFNAGPYIAIGVAGKSKVDTKVGPLQSNREQSIDFSNDDPFTSQQDDAAYDKLKRFDFGVNLGGGLAFKRLILKANYGLGLSKINSTESDNNANDKNKFRTVSISVGIPIGK